MAYGIHFYERLCRGGACLLEILFPRYFLHFEPFILPLDTRLSLELVHSFASGQGRLPLERC
jgi:hypothetical protein